VKAVLPYGQATVDVVEGGLDIISDCGSKVTIVANAAAVVYLDIDIIKGSDTEHGEH